MPDSQTVFALRKEGKLEESLLLARQLDLGDPWNIKAYGWCLHDALKTAAGPNAAEIMQKLFAEFEKIPIPDDDELLLKSRESWRNKIPAANNVTPLGELLQQAKQSSNAGNRQESLRLCRASIKSYPDAPQAYMSLGWEIQRALKDLVSEAAIDGQAVQKLLREYARIANVEKPGNLHSLILARAAKAATKEMLPNFIRFFKWWDPANLQADDFERFTPEGGDRAFDSRVEQVIRAIHKSSDTEENKENIAWAAEFVGQHYEKFSEQEWFPYYYGQLLIKTGDLERARELIIPIVRRKKGEFWAWHTLAGTFGPNEKDEKLACLCKSLLCHAQEEKFLVNVHAELGELLASQGNYGPAKYEIASSIEIREAQKPNPWKIPQKLRDLQSSGWYAQTDAPQNNKPFYQQYAAAAENLIFEGLPNFKAMLMHQIPPTEGSPGLSFVAYQVNERQEEAKVKTKHFDCLNNTKIGTPLTVQIDDSADPPLVVSIRPREGIPWDLIPDKIGLVRRVNIDGGVTSVALARDDFCLFHHDRFPEVKEFRAGDFVAVKVRTDVRHNSTVGLAVKLTDQEPSTVFFRRFEGTLDQPPERRFGFVNHEIFVSPDLIDENIIKGDLEVKGLAVLEFNRAKNDYSWAAVIIERA